MKLAICASALLLALVAVASAAPGSSGGYVYYNSLSSNWGTAGVSGKYIRLWRVQLGRDFTPVGSPVNYDNILLSNSATYETWQAAYFDRDIEVSTHNNLLVSAPYNNTPPSGGFKTPAWQIPWDVLNTTPSSPNATYDCVPVAQGGHANLLSDGRLYTAATDWRSRSQTRALAAPANWGGVNSNGVSLVTMQGYYNSPSYGIMYQYDANGNGTVDNTTTEGKVIYNSSLPPVDAEFGPDSALYVAFGRGTGLNTKTLTVRKFVTSGSTFDCTTFLTITGNHLISLDTDGPGLAVGGTSANPIVYLTAVDNVGGVNRAAVFALQDKNHDGVISWDPAVDCVTEVWREGDPSIGFGFTLYNRAYLEDVEYVDNGSKKTLLFNDYYNGLFALELADNGLAALSGKTIITSDYSLHSITRGTTGDGTGFEFDMNSVPEPATIMLLGSGALGVLGWMRRRRVK